MFGPMALNIKVIGRTMKCVATALLLLQIKDVTLACIRTASLMGRDITDGPMEERIKVIT